MPYLEFPQDNFLCFLYSLNNYEQVLVPQSWVLNM